MNIVAVKCPNCGANVDLEENQDVGFCKYCGTKIIRENPNEQKINIGGKIEVVNNEFESKLSLADTLAEMYFTKKHFNVFEYNKVINAYSAAEILGANESKYYLHIKDFVIKANLEAPHMFVIKQQIITSYDTFMKAAIRNEKDNVKKAEIEKNYEEEREKIIKQLDEKEKQIKIKNRTNSRAYGQNVEN